MHTTTHVALTRAAEAHRRAELLKSATEGVVGRCQAARSLRLHQRLERDRVRLVRLDGLGELRRESDLLRLQLRSGFLTADALRVLVHGGDAPRPRQAGDARRHLPRHLRVVLELIDSDLSSDLSTSRLAAACFLTPRALQMGFRRHFDLTPGQYVRLQRLRCARAELQRGDESTTVSSVAAGLGFVNAGRFAAAYRAHWGEAPSDTLRTARQVPSLHAP